MTGVQTCALPISPCQSTILIGLVSKVKNQAFPSLFSTNFLLVFHKTLYPFLCNKPTNKIEYRYQFNKKSAWQRQFCLLCHCISFWDCSPSNFRKIFVSFCPQISPGDSSPGAQKAPLWLHIPKGGFGNTDLLQIGAVQKIQCLIDRKSTRLNSSH